MTPQQLVDDVIHDHQDEAGVVDIDATLLDLATRVLQSRPEVKEREIWNDAIRAAAGALADDYYGPQSTGAQRDAIIQLIRLEPHLPHKEE